MNKISPNHSSISIAIPATAPPPGVPMGSGATARTASRLQSNICASLALRFHWRGGGRGHSSLVTRSMQGRPDPWRSPCLCAATLILILRRRATSGSSEMTSPRSHFPLHTAARFIKPALIAIGGNGCQAPGLLVVIFLRRKVRPPSSLAWSPVSARRWSLACSIPTLGSAFSRTSPSPSLLFRHSGFRAPVTRWPRPSKGLSGRPWAAAPPLSQAAAPTVPGSTLPTLLLALAQVAGLPPLSAISSRP